MNGCTRIKECGECPCLEQVAARGGDLNQPLCLADQASRLDWTGWEKPGTLRRMGQNIHMYDGSAWKGLGNLARMKVVALDGNDTYGDGSMGSPYATIQKAYDEAAAEFSPTQANPAGVLILPGRYDETVIVDQDHVALVGLGGQQVVNIASSSGPSLIITNASRASVATFLANGGQADPLAHYGDLAAGANVPRNVQIRDVSIGDLSGPANDLLIMGVGAGTSFGGSEINFMRCCVWGSVFARLANYISLQGATWLAKRIYTHNIAGLWVNDSQITGADVHYTTLEDEPSDNGNYGLCGGKSLCNGSVHLTGEARAGAGDPNGGLVLFQVTGDLDLDDTSDLTMASSGVGGNIDAEGGAGFDIKNVHVQGGISMAAGAGVCQMDGGAYMGALVDPGVKFVRNVGA